MSERVCVYIPSFLCVINVSCLFFLFFFFLVLIDLLWIRGDLNIMDVASAKLTRICQCSFLGNHVHQTSLNMYQAVPLNPIKNVSGMH